MATSNERKPSFLRGFEKPIALIAAFGAAATLAACGPSASAEKGPEKAPAASAPITPGSSEAAQTTAPTTQETAPAKTEVVDGIDTTGMSPVAVELAGGLTPEKVLAMSHEQRTKAFAVSYEQIQKAVAESNGKLTEEEAYAQLSYVSFTSALHSSCSLEASKKYTHDQANVAKPSIRGYMRDEYLVPAFNGLLGEEATKAIPADQWEQFTGFASRCDIMQQVLDAEKQQGYPNNDGKPVPPYAINFSMDKSTLNVLHHGTGHYGEALSVEYTVNFEEPNDYLKVAAMQGLDGNAGSPVNGQLHVTFDNVVARGNTAGDQRLYVLQLQSTAKSNEAPTN